MPKYDIYHKPVTHVLSKDGWTITDDPYVLATDDDSKPVLVQSEMRFCKRPRRYWQHWDE
jgi:hypothetical protein